MNDVEITKEIGKIENDYKRHYKEKKYSFVARDNEEVIGR